MPENFEPFRETPWVGLLGAGITFIGGVAALVCGIMGLVLKSRKTHDHRPYVRWARSLAGAVLLLAVIGCVSGLIHTLAAFNAQGLSQSDKQRILANGIAESLYNLMFALVIGGPGLVLGFVGRLK